MSVSMVMRGEVVVVDFSITYPKAGKRPALVIQSDQNNLRMQNTIVAQITTNISRAHLMTQLLIDEQHVDWKQSGLRAPSVVNCASLVTITKSDVVVQIGHLSEETMQQIDECLKDALGMK